MATISQLKVCVGNEVMCVDKIKDDAELLQYMQSKCAEEDAFMVVDVGRLFSLHAKWKATLPGIFPFYAVKCNEDKLLLKTLAAMGTGFDCASKNEIQTVLALGVPPDRIIYANPCKQISHLKYAAQKGVDLMTFDNKWELKKVKEHFPTAKLVIRIRADDPDAICQLGIKFGCSMAVGMDLLNTAMDLGLQVVGVSFHVGSGCQTPAAYQNALKLSSEMFQYATSIGYGFTLLDIGGGYPGDQGSDQLFNNVASSINTGIEAYFNREDFPNLTIIAEPGRYFACSTHTIVVNVISKRLQKGEGPGEESSYMYYVNDGVYGSFNCVMYDHHVPTPSLLKNTGLCSPRYATSLWGPTCDGLDKICEALMPELDIGDWVYFEDMGAYTISAYSPFNGFAKPIPYYYVREADSSRFEDLVAACPVEMDAVVRSTSKTSTEYFLADYGQLSEVQGPTLGPFTDSLLYYYSVL